jgi:hypothetical protein
MLGLLALFSLVPAAPAMALPPSPTMGISDVTVTEGGAAAFTVTVRGAHPQLSVDYTTRDGSATAPGDYPVRINTLNIPASQNDSQVVINVPTVQDNIFEPTETFFVDLSNTVADLRKSTGQANIENDDQVPEVSIEDGSSAEGDDFSNTTDLFLDVKLSNPASAPVSVDFQTGDGTALGNDPQVLHADFVDRHGTIVFPANSNATQQLRIRIKGDDAYEESETFRVLLSNPVNARLGDAEATATITNNDVFPVLSISNGGVIAEGDSGPHGTGLIVSLSNPSQAPVSYTFETANDSAVAPSDYVSVNRRKTIDPFQSLQFISVDIVGDQFFEGDETFSVLLDNPTNAVLGDSSATVTITNDDFIIIIDPPLDLDPRSADSTLAR